METVIKQRNPQTGVSLFSLISQNNVVVRIQDNHHLFGVGCRAVEFYSAGLLPVDS